MFKRSKGSLWILYCIVLIQSVADLQLHQATLLLGSKMLQMRINRTDSTLKWKYWRKRNTDRDNISVYVKMLLCMFMCTHIFHSFLEIFKLKDPVCCRDRRGEEPVTFSLPQTSTVSLLYSVCAKMRLHRADFTLQICITVTPLPLCRFWMGNSEYEPNPPVNTSIDSSGLWSTSLVTPSYLFPAISPFSLLLSYFDARQKIILNLNISFWLLMLMSSISF